MLQRKLLADCRSSSCQRAGLGLIALGDRPTVCKAQVISRGRMPLIAGSIVTSEGVHRSVLERGPRCIREDDALWHLIDHGRQPGAFKAFGLIEARGFYRGPGARGQPLDGLFVGNCKLRPSTLVRKVKIA